VTAGGNWEHQNILNRPKTSEQAAKVLKLDVDELESLLASCRAKLFAARSKRIPPGRDDKILVSWNGLMIAAMAQAGAILDEPKYLAAAKSAAEFILSQMTRLKPGLSLGQPGFISDQGNPGLPELKPGFESHRLQHCWKDGRARFNGYLDDYACLIDGFVELSQAALDPRYLHAACEFAAVMIDQFSDPDHGGFFYTSSDHETLIARNKEIHDNATPSGNSMAATALLKLARRTGRRDFEAKAVETLEMMSGTLSRLPTAAGQALIALDFLIGPAYELLLLDGDDQTAGDQALEAIRQRFIPNKVVWRQTSGQPVPAELAALLSGKSAANTQTSLYVCREGVCQAPAAGASAIETAIQTLGGS
jgi:uncharacterized protein YyaL (SSP411 family)